MILVLNEQGKSNSNLFSSDHIKGPSQRGISQQESASLLSERVELKLKSYYIHKVVLGEKSSTNFAGLYNKSGSSCIYSVEKPAIL